ncbi:hypothetical protein ACFYPN_05995 [Streptomyces sp. NPDC005576]|uniref:hypothetical protein n=1 Tax=Streptomyces sp. NPDC005576 TaxID=3364726 RepID=UPI0036891E7F
MRGHGAGRLLVSHVDITSTTVLCGDIIQVGGRACRVTNLLQLPHGAKQLLLDSGELLTMHPRTRFVAVRMMRRR